MRRRCFEAAAGRRAGATARCRARSSEAEEDGPVVRFRRARHPSPLSTPSFDAHDGVGRLGEVQVVRAEAARERLLVVRPRRCSCRCFARLSAWLATERAAARSLLDARASQPTRSVAGSLVEAQRCRDARSVRPQSSSTPRPVSSAPGSAQEWWTSADVVESSSRLHSTKEVGGAAKSTLRAGLG